MRVFILFCFILFFYTFQIVTHEAKAGEETAFPWTNHEIMSLWLAENNKLIDFRVISPLNAVAETT